MAKTSAQVAVPTQQIVAFRRLHEHLVASGAIAAASLSTIDEPRSLAYSLRLRDGTTQTTTLEFAPAAAGCSLTVSVNLDHQDRPEGAGWLPPNQLAEQHRTLAEIFARIASGTA